MNYEPGDLPVVVRELRFRPTSNWEYTSFRHARIVYTPFLPFQVKRDFFVLPASACVKPGSSKDFNRKEEKNMSETTTKKTSKQAILAGIIAVALIAAFAIIYYFASPKPSQGAKALTIEVVNDKVETTTYEVHTDAEYLRQAMEETEGLTFEGTESEYGLMVETVNGVTADYNKDGAYWAFYVDGEYCNYGIDTQPVNDGETYSIVYTVY